MPSSTRYLLAVVFGWLLAFSALAPNPAWGEWQTHRIRQGDGRGGWVTRPALRQVLKHPDANFTMPFGLVQMDNGEVALLCSREKVQPAGNKTFEPIIAFSKNGGADWSEFTIVPGTTGRPQYLEWLGGRRLSFITEVFHNAGKPQRVFSDDYGRTWTRSVDQPPTREGRAFGVEGNAWIDRDQQGTAQAILELGWHYAPGKSHPKDDATVVFRRSRDGGRTWIDEVAPPQWKFTVEHNGKKWLRGVSEGAIVRAANGNLVAALRSDMPPKYFDGPHDDSLEGTAISVSRDDGKSWSEMQFLFDAGRHHANLQRLPNGDLVCTLVVRDDIQDGKLASHRRGCDALVSQDHGRSWNLDRRFELDRFDFLRGDGYWVDGQCGHIGSVVLAEGHVISAYGHYRLGAAVLIKWKPDAAPVQPVPKVGIPILPRILPPGSETLNFVDYTPARILKRRAVLGQIPARDLPTSLICTLHDDNVGLVPQLATGTLHEITQDLRRHGWSGFSTRYWLIGDHDPCVAYLSRAAWDATATPDAVYRDQIRAVCGADCLEELLTVLREVEAATVELEWHGLGFTFPVAGMLMKHWVPEPLPPELARVRDRYDRALAAARQVRDKSSPRGRAWVAYWIGRLEFGVGYFDAVHATRRAARAERDGQITEARQRAAAALQHVRQALEAYARVAGDQSDRGAIAVMAEYVYRPLKQKVAQLQERSK